MRSNLQPTTGADLIDAEYFLPPHVLRATRDFARSKPWRGSIDERKAKWQAFNKALAWVCLIPEPTLTFGDVESGGPSDESAYRRDVHNINLRGRLSVVTLLNLFAAALGFNGLERYRWSLNLFARCFPISFSRCHFEGLLLRKSAA